MNEPLKTQHIIGGLGRNKYDGGYYDSSYFDEDSVKQVERERVFDFINQHCVDPIRLLSMPGIRWKFEVLCLTKRSDSQFVGLESNKLIYLRSKRNIPGVASKKIRTQSGKTRLIDHTKEIELKFGANGTVLYSSIRRKKNNAPRKYNFVRCGDKSNRLLVMSSDVFVSMVTTNYKQTMKQINCFASKFYFRNCVWLDFTCQICNTVEKTIVNLPICLVPDDKRKPVVITLMKARDSFHSDEERIAHILTLCKDLNYDSHWTYTGTGNTPMLTMCFTVV